MTNGEAKARNRRKRPAAATTPNPVEIAMEIAAHGTTPADAAMAVLHANAALMNEQVSLSREQIGLARNERFRNRIRSVRDTAIAAVVVALIVALGAVFWSASRTTGLVIQPFSTPTQLAEDGLDGRAVAALFQDELSRLEASTISARPAASFRNDWSGAISVEVEAGGLSLTDAYTALSRWLGKETYISGGLRRTPTGLELVVRTGDGTAITVQGPAEQPEALMRQAAERLYEQTQPYRYSQYLALMSDARAVGPERQALIGRSQAILTTLLYNPSEMERIWAYNGLSQAADTPLRDTIPILEAALELDPDHPNILVNMGDHSSWLGFSEASLLYNQRVLSAMSTPRGRAKVASDRHQFYPLAVGAEVAWFQGDYQRVLELYTRLASLDISSAPRFRDARVDALIALHQPSALSRLIEVQAVRGSGSLGQAQLLFRRAEAAAILDQWPQAAAALEAFDAGVGPTLPLRARPLHQTFLRPRLAYARARTGDLAGAQALIATTPLDCYLCVRERARIAELAGDRTGADRWSAEARRQGPSLPFAFAERGQMLMARGDTAGAIPFYARAIERGPRWAEPQKYWGDVLMAQGDERGAIRKYRAAADRAPQWGALHLAWGRALEADARRNDAREKYAEAARMDLSATDRAEVVRRLAAVSRGS